MRGADLVEGLRTRGGVVRQNRRAGHDPDLLLGQAVALDEVAPAPRGHRHHRRGSLAMGAVDGLAAPPSPATEVLGEVEVLEIVRLVEARNLGGEGVLEWEVDDVGPSLFDGPVRAPDREPMTDRGDPLGQGPPDGARATSPVRTARVQYPARALEVGEQPILVLGICEEEGLLVAVADPGQT